MFTSKAVILHFYLSLEENSTLKKTYSLYELLSYMIELSVVKIINKEYLYDLNIAVRGKLILPGYFNSDIFDWSQAVDDNDMFVWLQTVDKVALQQTFYSLLRQIEQVINEYRMSILYLKNKAVKTLNIDYCILNYNTIALSFFVVNTYEGPND